MSAIQACALPEQALLAKYTRDDAYTDCYTTEVARPVSHAEYVEAFYTGAVFKLERLLLAWFVFRPSTDAQARELASGRLNTFAAWQVEARSTNQLLMCDLSGRTSRSAVAHGIQEFRHVLLVACHLTLNMGDQIRDLSTQRFPLRARRTLLQRQFRNRQCIDGSWGVCFQPAVHIVVRLRGCKHR